MPCKNLRFLIVEDHEFQRNAVVQLLLSLGRKPFTAQKMAKQPCKSSWIPTGLLTL